MIASVVHEIDLLDLELVEDEVIREVEIEYLIQDLMDVVALTWNDLANSHLYQQMEHFDYVDIQIEMELMMLQHYFDSVKPISLKTG